MVFFSKSFLTVLIGVVVAAFLDSAIIMILKGGTGNFSFSFYMALGASCLVGFVTFFLRSKSRKRKAQKREHEKIKEYGERINEKTRNKWHLGLVNLKLCHQCAKDNFKRLKIEIIDNVLKLLKGTEIGLYQIQSWRLRKETLIILNIAKRLCNLLKRNDPLEKKIKLSRIDLIFCFFKGIMYD